jgi:immune inhibitor A
LALLTDSIDDISIYDSNNDGFIDCVFIIYAGESQNQGGAANTVWACNFNITPKTITDKQGNTRKASLATCSGELVTINSKGTLYKVISGVGVPCHEFSHALGLPDIYPTSSPADKTDNQEMEYWDLMDGGEYVRNGFCPAPYTAWEKWQMGWDNSNIQTLTEANTYTMTPYTQPGAVAYKIENPGNSNEYILLEYVAHEGWASYMPAEGLLAYHVVDYGDITRSSRYNDIAGKPRMAIIPADSICANYYNVEKEEYKASLTHDLFPNNGYITALNDTLSLPNFYWYTNPGTGLKSKTNSNFYAINQALKDITMDENGISFTYIPDFATGIKGVTVRTAPADNRIYTVDGRYVGRDESKLPKGIYIRRGQLIAL